jgi:hypothetical protein
MEEKKKGIKESVPSLPKGISMASCKERKVPMPAKKKQVM